MKNKSSAVQNKFISRLESVLPTREIFFMRILGFKHLRYRQWLVVVRREGKRHSLVDFIRMVLLMGWRALHVGVNRPDYRRRIKACHKCDLFDPELKRCRPYDGSKLGCGCFCPFVALVRKPYPKGCWGRQFIADDFGWS